MQNSFFKIEISFYDLNRVNPGAVDVTHSQ